MKVVIVGGTGLVGSKLARFLSTSRSTIVVASPRTGVDALTGRNLSHALSGADVVIDVSNAPSLDQAAAAEFFRISTSNILAAARDAGVQHHVSLSIIGTGRLPEWGYFRAKMLQENLIRTAAMPFTILRSAPLFEYLDGIVKTSNDGETISVSPALVQPVAADDAAAALRDVAFGGPQDRVVELVGPDTFRLTEIAQHFLTLDEDPRTIIHDWNAPYFGAALRADSLMPEAEALVASTRFEDWFRNAIAETLAPMA